MKYLALKTELELEWIKESMGKLKTNFRVHYRISERAYREDFLIIGDISGEIKLTSAWERIIERHPGVTHKDVKILYIYPFCVWQ